MEKDDPLLTDRPGWYAAVAGMSRTPLPSVQQEHWACPRIGAYFFIE
jgi:hypothetical protein